MTVTRCDDFAEKNFYAMFNLNPRACLIWDMELTVLEWNKSAEEMFGYSRGEIVGKTLYDTVLDGLVDADDVITAIKTQLEKEHGRVSEYQ